MDARDPIEKGQLVASKYRIEERIGSGSMGVVYAARHEELDERVALKFLSPLLAQDEQARARFQREAKNAFGLKSEHVARVFDVGRTDDGAPYIVMEFLDGVTLKRHVQSKGKLSQDESISILIQTCEGVAEAHARGIVHRDLKPENVFLTNMASGAPIVKVLDFGISKGLPSSTKGMAITGHDQVMGTPRYMSPEQYEKTTEVTSRSDVWSLGVIAYWLFSGTFPFTGQTAREQIVSLFSGELPTPLLKNAPDVEPGLEAVVMKCLSRASESRFKDADALRRAFTPFFRGSVATPASKKTKDSVPATHRSAIAHEDSPTLEQAKSSHVTVAKAAPPTDRETDRALGDMASDSNVFPATKIAGAPTRRPEADTVRQPIAHPIPDPPKPPTQKTPTETAPEPAPEKVSAEKAAPENAPAKQDMHTTAALANAPARPIEKPIEKKSDVNAGTVRMVRPQVEQRETLPLGMVYNQDAPKAPSTPAPSETAAPEVAHSSPPEIASLAEPEDLPALPIRPAGRARVAIVLIVFAFVFMVVWMLTKK